MSQAPETAAAAPPAPAGETPGLLGLVMMLSSSLAASVSLGLLSYTFATGSLPFGIQPLVASPEGPARPASSEEAPADGPVRRPGEHYAWRLYQAMEAEQARLAKEKRNLAEERRQLEEWFRSADLREAELQRMESRIAGLLDRVDETEVANIKQMGDLLEQADGKAAAEMLLGMEQDLAARVLYFMDERKSAELINAMQKHGEASKNKAVRLLEKLHLITEDAAS